MADQDNESKKKNNDFQDIYKSRESAREPVVIANTKHLTAEHSLAKTNVVTDEALAKAPSLESERKRLAQSVADDAVKCLVGPFLKKRLCASS